MDRIEPEARADSDAPSRDHETLSRLKGALPRLSQKLAVGALCLASLTACQRSKDPVAAAGGAALITCMRTFVTGLSDPAIAYGKYTKPVVETLFAVDANVTIDRSQSQVTAVSALDGKTYSATAVYRPGVGCTSLVNLDAARLRGQAFTAPEPVAIDPNAAWPSGGAGAKRDTYYDTYAQAVERNLFAANNALFTHAVAIARNGELVFERYDPDFNANSRLPGFSLTKTVLSLGLGILADEGAFTLEDKLPIAGFETQANRGNFRQFLYMESGISWNEDNPYLRSSIGTTLFHYGDQAAYVASRAQSAEPGTKFQYNTGNSILLARSLQNLLLGTRSPSAENSLQAGTDFFQDRLFAPLHITSAVIQADETGTLGGGSMALMTARDWLRLGQLVLDNGRAFGAEVVSSEWIQQTMLTPSLDKTYGGHIWLAEVQARSSSGATGATYPVAYFSGIAGQKIFVVPSHKLVFARLGTSMPNQARNETFAALAELLYALPTSP